MRAMRFVLFGAVGFGSGWAVAGFLTSGFIAITAPMFPPHSPPPPLVDELPYLSWLFTGACGGASLGVALGYLENCALVAGRRPRVR